MKPSQIVNAYKAILELDNVPMPYRTARQVAALRKRLKEEFDVIRGMEEALAADYGGKFDGASYQFETTETARAFAGQLNAVMDQDDAVNLPGADLSGTAEALHLSPFAVAALDGLIKFEGDK